MAMTGCVTGRELRRKLLFDRATVIIIGIVHRARDFRLGPALT
jgi:hypothetical protein